MEWLWTAALLPFLLCGLMCFGAVALAALGLRQRRGRQRDCCGSEEDSTKTSRATPVR